MLPQMRSASKLPSIPFYRKIMPATLRSELCAPVMRTIGQGACMRILLMKEIRLLGPAPGRQGG